jgi:hypothetical protein
MFSFPTDSVTCEGRNKPPIHGVRYNRFLLLVAGLGGLLYGGNAPRNMLRGFGDNQINVAIRKEIHLYDSFNLQVRAEAYNLFNHPNLGYIDPSLTDALFGQSTLMLNQSFGPTGSLYEPGGPRSLQISLRVHF